MNKNITSRMVAMSKILSLLMRGSVSREELRREAGVTRVYILYLIMLLRENKQIYRSGVGLNSAGQPTIELFSLGDKEDVTLFKSGPVRRRKKMAPPTSTSKLRTVWVAPVPDQIKDMTLPVRSRRRPLVVVPKAVSEVTSTE